jgi:hypothetical protein
VPILILVRHCTTVVDSWPCYTLKGAGSRGEMLCFEEGGCAVTVEQEASFAIQVCSPTKLDVYAEITDQWLRHIQQSVCW